MLDMANKKHKYQYAKITKGGAIPVAEIPEQTGTQAFREVGMFAIGKAKEQEGGRYYRQPRELSKTLARFTGRDMSGEEVKDLLDIEGVVGVRNVYTRTMGVLIKYLIESWQTSKLNDRGFATIKSLSKVSKETGIGRKELRGDLAKVLGYVLPYIVNVKTGKKRDYLTIKEEKLFDYEVVVSVDKEGGNPRFEKINHKPTERIRNAIGRDDMGRELRGRGLHNRLGIGSVLTPVENILLGLELSHYAYILYEYMNSNTPKGQIGFEKLCPHLGITEDKLAQQGKPRYRKYIKEGLEELKEKGYLERWSYSKTKDMYYWRCSKKVYLHPSLSKTN